MGTDRPYVQVNVAMSADGKIDTAARQGAGISSPADRERVDRLRAAADAVLVGGRTLLDEDPALTVRSGELRAQRLRRGKPENPIKVGVVSEIGPDDLPASCDFLARGPAQVLVFTTRRTSPRIVRRLEAAGVRVHLGAGERVDLAAAFEFLYAADVRSVLVEGGGTLLAELFRLGLADELSLYIAPRIFAGASAPTPADGPGFSEADAPELSLESVERIDANGGILANYHVVHKE